MKVYFNNARIMTLAAGADIFFGDLITEGDRILYCGPPLEPGEAFAAGCDRVIDVKGNPFTHDFFALLGGRHASGPMAE